MSSTDEIETEVLDRLAGPAARLACAGWLELEEKGFTDESPNLHSGYRCVVAHAPDGRQRVPAGVIVFQEHPPGSGTAFAYISYVLPEFRGRGVYAAMFDALVAWAINAGIRIIESIVSMKNEAMRAIAKRQHRVEESVIVRMVLS